MPATTWRTSAPISTSNRSSLSAPFTFSAAFTCPTRSSTLRKSSMVILPSSGCSEGFDAEGIEGVAGKGPAVGGAAALLPFLSHSPRFLFDEITVHRTDHRPSGFESSGKLVFIEQAPKFRDHRLSLVLDYIISRLVGHGRRWIRY